MPSGPANHVKARNFRPRAGRPGWVYAVVFLLGAAFLLGITAYRITAEYGNTRSAWSDRLSTEVMNRAWILRSWLLEARSDAVAVARFPPVREVLLQQRANRARNISASRQLKVVLALLDEYRTIYGYSSAYILDAAGRLVAQTGKADGANLPLEDISRAVARSGKFKIELLGANPESSLIIFAEPVSAEPRVAKRQAHSSGAVLGVVLLADRLADEVFPPLAAKALQTRTGETLLLRLQGGRVVYFSPRLNSSGGSIAPIRSRDTLRRAVGKAVEGRATSGEFTDYRGVRVIASFVKLPLISGVLVSKADLKETFAEFHHSEELEVVLAGAAMVLYGGLLLGYRRSLLAHEMREKLSQQDAIIKLKEYAQQIVDSVPSGLLVLSSDCKVLSASRSFLTAFRLRSEEVVGRSLQEVVLVEGLPVKDAQALRREAYPRIVHIRLNLRK
jgi:PAS domain-containing protein